MQVRVRVLRPLSIAIAVTLLVSGAGAGGCVAIIAVIIIASSLLVSSSSCWCGHAATIANQVVMVVETLAVWLSRWSAALLTLVGHDGRIIHTGCCRRRYNASLLSDRKTSAQVISVYSMYR